MKILRKNIAVISPVAAVGLLGVIVVLSNKYRNSQIKNKQLQEEKQRIESDLEKMSQDNSKLAKEKEELQQKTQQRETDLTKENQKLKEINEQLQEKNQNLERDNIELEQETKQISQSETETKIKNQALIGALKNKISDNVRLIQENSSLKKDKVIERSTKLMSQNNDLKFFCKVTIQILSRPIDEGMSEREAVNYTNIIVDLMNSGIIKIEETKASEWFKIKSLRPTLMLTRPGAIAMRVTGKTILPNDLASLQL